MENFTSLYICVDIRTYTSLYYYLGRALSAVIKPLGLHGQGLCSNPDGGGK